MANKTSHNDAHLIEALKTGRYADLEIQCQDLVLKVHRIVVCTRSKPIAAMLDGNFREAIEGIIDLPDDEPEVVTRMIQFLYTSDYSDLTSSPLEIQSIPSSGNRRRKASGSIKSVSYGIGKADLLQKDYNYIASNLLLHIELYIIGDKFDIQSLKDISASKYSQLAPTQWNSPFFFESITLLYENTMESDTALKPLIARLLQEHTHALLKRPEFTNVLKRCPEVGIDLLKYAAYSMPHVYERVGFRCETCKRPCQGKGAYCTHRVFWKDPGVEPARGYNLFCANNSCGNQFSTNDLICEECGPTVILKEIRKPLASYLPGPVMIDLS